MKKTNPSYYLLLAGAVLILSTLACNSLQVGVVTPTAEPSDQPISEESESPPTTEVEEVAEETQAEETGPTFIEAVAWQGHIASMPEGSQFDDVLILNPEGTGEYGLTGATPEIEAEIRTLRDGEAAQMYVHLWGSFSCEVEDVNGCQLVVDRLQSGAMMAEEEIVNWVGTIQGFNFNMGPVMGFVLEGDVPMHYGIYASQDEAIRNQIESLRDTGSLIRVSGKLLVGFPDLNSTRIEVSSLEVLESGSEVQPTQETFDPTADWQGYTNTRYGYEFKYPNQATLHFYGPEGFAMEDLPEGMTPEEFMDARLKEYTDQLCIEIEYSLGFIYISAPPNNQGELLVHCGVPAWGAGETTSVERNVTIGDEVYLASGVEFFTNNPSGETLDLHAEILWIDLDDGVKIAFGATPRPDATFEDYQMKTQMILERIIGTYQTLQ